MAIVGSLVSDKCMLLYALAVNGVERSHQACPNSIPNIPQTTQTFTGAYAESTWQWCGFCLLMMGADEWGRAWGCQCDVGSCWSHNQCVCNLVMFPKSERFALLSSISTTKAITITIYVKDLSLLSYTKHCRV